MAKSSRHDKRAKEIEEIKIKLPDDNFKIELSDNNSSVTVNSYQVANSIILYLIPDMNAIISGLGEKYVFASFATDKNIAKKLKISISTFVHKNYTKTK